MFMFPLLSSMHFVKFCVAPAQLLPQLLLLVFSCAAATGAASAGALDPPKMPPTALLSVWPTAEPTATPLLLVVQVSACPASGEGKGAYAAVVAIWANRPGAWPVGACAVGVDECAGWEAGGAA